MPNVSRFFGPVLASAALAVYFWLPTPTLAALAPGDLVKLADDGNPATTADSAVYYHGADGKRYVFPNSQTYFTWYADFSRVTIVSGAEMAALPIGGNITYRPGTRLVKIVSDPNVYAVEPNGTLRWIQSEAVALALYGEGWNRRIDDIPDAFFFNYKQGDPLAAAVYPTGSVVKRTSDGAYYYIDGRNKRKLPTAEVRTGLRFEEKDVLTASGDLADYPDGTEISATETALGDTAQKNLVAAPATPTFSVRVPASSFIAVGGDATLLEVHIASAAAVTVRKMTVRLDATTGAGAEAASDTDLGGLVYGNNAQPNFQLLRFINVEGNEPFGRRELNLNVVQDQSQTLVFTGSLPVAANRDNVVYFKAQLNKLLPANEKYKATLVMAGTEVTSEAGGLVVAEPATELASPELTSLSLALKVESSGNPGSKTYVRGAKGADIAGLTFKATIQAPNVIKAVTFQGYVDNEGLSNFLPGSDSDGGMVTTVRDLVSSVSLYDTAGALVGGPVPISLTGQAAFTGLNFYIPAGQSAVLILRGDISSTVELGTVPDKITFDVENADQDLVVVDERGNSVLASGHQPNGGPKAGAFTTVKKNGTVGFGWAGVTATVLAGREELLGTFSADAKDDQFELRNLTFRQVGGPAKTASEVRLSYVAANGQTVDKILSWANDTVTFSNLNVALPRDKKTEFKLYVKLLAKDAGAVYNESVKVQFSASGPMEWRGLSDGQVYGESALGSADFPLANAASNLTVRYSSLTASVATDVPGAAYHDNNSPVLRFFLKADPAGAVRFAKFAFKLAPDDANTPGTRSDALELWPEVNGDFQEDDGVASLYRVYPGGTEKTLIAEGGNGHINYSHVHGGVKDTTPSGTVSAPGDYGLLEYAFNDGDEFFIPAGVTANFELQLNTSAIASDKDHKVTAELLGGTDFVWTDIPMGAYTPLTGSQAAGIPLSGSVDVKI